MAVAALVGAAEFNAGHFARQHPDLVVAVDGGFGSLAAAGVVPDVAVGDFDSLGHVPAGPDVRVHPPEKDESDMELGLRIARERNCATVLLYGALGGRMDHELANLQLMAAFARSGGRVFAIGAHHAVALLHGGGGRRGLISFRAVPPHLLASGPYRNHISVFAYGGEARGVCERGLKYRLDDAAVRDDVSLGLSNEFAGAPASVGVGEGDLVVIFPLAAWGYLEGGE